MSSPFCNDCREKEKQQNNQHDTPQRKGSPQHENNNRGPTGQRSNGGSSKGSPHDSQACEVCWGGKNHNAMELPIMSSEFCNRCIGKQKQGSEGGSDYGLHNESKDRTTKKSHNKSKDP